MLRQLFRELRGDRGSVVKVYAGAERRGEVQRRRNSRRMTPEEYASRLFHDGVQKKWIEQA